MQSRFVSVRVLALCVLIVLLMLAGDVSAHAFLRTSDPTEDSTIASLPKEVRLAFTESVETRFSTFKVYRLDADPGAEIRRLNAAGGALVSDVLQKRGDEAARADAGLSPTTRTSTDITIRLKPDLEPGAYVVMWRVLSIDTHTTQGFFVFIAGRRTTRVPPSVAGDGSPASTPKGFSAASAPFWPEPFIRPTSTPTLEARAEAGQNQPTNPRVSGVLTYKYTHAPMPAAAGDENYNGTSVDNPTVHEGSLELAMTLTLARNVSLFANVNTRSTSDTGTAIEIERLHLDLQHTLGVMGLHFRIGRDAIRLGPVGLLLDEVLHDEDRRDGVQVWLPPMGPIRLTAFMQWALTDWTTTRRLLGGRADASLPGGWILGLNYRADTSSDADAGTCPGTDCATGRGFGVDVEGNIVSGLNLVLSYATYTQTGDVARFYYQASLVIDLETLARMPRFGPVLTLWYKNFDPYTIPGGLGSVPRGGFLTPDSSHQFNVNDNLTAMGSRLDLRLLNNLTVFALGEWGTYKDGGPVYSVFSAGARYTLPHNVVIKITYNTYSVNGGMVTTSPISGLQVADTRLYEVEVTKSW